MLLKRPCGADILRGNWETDMEAITIPLVIALFVLGSAAGGYYAIFHGMSGGAGILIVLAVLIAILIAVQNKFPNKR
jgi:hypothetical protein